MRRKGFTMIELVFVVVILGILAVAAIPKLSATRDDAKASKAVTNLATCILDVAAEYTAQGTESGASDACLQLDCFSVAFGALNDGAITTATASGPLYCTAAHNLAIHADMIGDMTFGQSQVSF